MRSFRFLSQIPVTDVERVVDALERTWREAEPQPHPAPPPTQADAPARLRREDLYQEAARVLGRREQTLRHDASVVDALLGRLRSRLSPLPQVLVRLRGGAGEVTAGRFRLRNTSDSAASFSFHPMGRSDGALVFRFTPPHPLVAAGESVVVTVRVEVPLEGLLEASGASPAEELHEVDVYADGAPGLKLWVELAGDDPVPPPSSPGPS